MLRRSVVSAALGACLVGGVLSPASATPSPVVLAGSTVIALSASAASTEVQVPRTVAFGGQCYGDRAVSVTGSADIALVALFPVGGGVPQYFGRFPQRQGRATFSNLCGDGAAIAAGTYTLVALRSPGTATLTLRLDGLSGQAKVLPRTPSSAVLTQLAPIAAYEPTRGNVETFGATHRLSSPGALAVAGWVDQSADALLTMGVCDKKREATTDPLADAVDFAPGCPTGGGSNQLPGLRGDGVSYIASTYSDIEAASWGSGFYYVSQGPVVSAGAVGAWIPFRD